jgi:hypothetical protein
MFEKRVMLMEAWADYCGKVQESATITAIRRSA